MSSVLIMSTWHASLSLWNTTVFFMPVPGLSLNASSYESMSSTCLNRKKFTELPNFALGANIQNSTKKQHEVSSQEFPRNLTKKKSFDLIVTNLIFLVFSVKFLRNKSLFVSCEFASSRIYCKISLEKMCPTSLN